MTVLKEIKHKLPSINNSIFFEKLQEAELRPDKSYFVYILPHNCWLELDNIVELTKTHVTFSYTGSMDGKPYLFEETIKLDSIKSFKVGIPLPDTEEEAIETLDDLFELESKEREAGENAITNQEN